MLFRNISAFLFVIFCMSASYFYALQIPWLPIMSLTGALGFLGIAIGCHHEGL